MNILASTYLEYSYGSSDKFYRISLIENGGAFSVPVDYGRRGTAGQHTTKYSGPDRAAAEKAYAKAENEKIGKGYVAATDPSAAYTAPTAPAPTPAPAAQSANVVERFPAQLAGENGKLGEAIADPDAYVAEEKFDGVRALVAINPDGTIQIRNRSGEDKGRIANTPDIKAAIEQLVAASPDLAKGTILDGELTGKSWNETMKLLGSAGKATKGLRFMVFDLPYSAGRDLRGLTWRERRAELESLLAGQPADSPVQLTPIFKPVDGLVESIWDRGGEGLILKDPNARYMPGDRNAWTKVKQVHTTEGVIIGFTAGNGKYADTIGAIVVGQYRDGQMVEVTNLSGMPDDIRRALSDDDLGKVIEFAYQSKTVNGSYRHGRYLRERPDKTASECTWEASA